MIAKSLFSGCWQWKIRACVALAGTLSVGVSGGVLAQVVPCASRLAASKKSKVFPDESTAR